MSCWIAKRVNLLGRPHFAAYVQNGNPDSSFSKVNETSFPIVPS